MRAGLFVCFCIAKYNGIQGEVCRQLKIFLNPRLFMLLTVLKRWSGGFLILCGFLYYRTGRFMF